LHRGSRWIAAPAATKRKYDRPARPLLFDQTDGWELRAVPGLDGLVGGDQVDDAVAVESVEDELDGKRREQETEDLLGHEHAALI
jgi:hypothetical protein